MNLLTRLYFLTKNIVFILSLFTVHAYALTSNNINTDLRPINPLKEASCDNDELANKCRELALKIDWLSRYQDRPACTQNLDGTPIYFAGHHLDKNNTLMAEELLEETMVKLNFAFAIGCYGQNDIKELSSTIKILIQALHA